jgi:hypothetical protein
VFIKKCIRDVVPTLTIKTYPNQKPRQSGVAIQWLRHKTYVAESTGSHGLQK